MDDSNRHVGCCLLVHLRSGNHGAQNENEMKCRDIKSRNFYLGGICLELLIFQKLLIIIIIIAYKFSPNK